MTRIDKRLRLFNGDIGIALVDLEAAGSSVSFSRPDGTMRKFDPYRLPGHETVFAMTIHKSQGTEFDRVLLLLPESDARVLTCELLYTGVTRLRKRVDSGQRRPCGQLCHEDRAGERPEGCLGNKACSQQPTVGSQRILCCRL
ncbi:MAG: ATP-binding domain-containing protein [Desulfobacterales bacterium]|nr:ATP-binding domain-containing protein [Desulfobacterales bacterium]